MPVVKIIEVIGTSPKSWDQAAENALKEAVKTVRNITGINIKKCTATVKNGKITEYRTTVKIAFLVERVGE